MKSAKGKSLAPTNSRMSQFIHSRVGAHRRRLLEDEEETFSESSSSSHLEESSSNEDEQSNRYFVFVLYWISFSFIYIFAFAFLKSEKSLKPRRRWKMVYGEKDVLPNVRCLNGLFDRRILIPRTTITIPMNMETQEGNREKTKLSRVWDAAQDNRPKKR